MRCREFCHAAPGTLLAGLCLLLLSFLPSTVPADTFRLADGKLVRGELLKDRPDSFVVDLGFEVVVIPKKLVEEHLTDEQAAARPPDAGAPAAPAGEPAAATAPAAEPAQVPASPTRAPARPTPAGAFYSTSGPAVTGVRDAAQKFGPAVVTVSTPSGLGSGFVIDGAGHVITNAHVVSRETQISLIVFLLSKGAATKPTEAEIGQAQAPGAAAGPESALERRKVEQVRIVAIDPFLDLALLQAQELSTLNVPHVYLGDSDLLRVGQEVFAVGAPLGLERSVSQGIVSSIERNLGGILYVQTTAAINPGNSGGPLFDIQGRVIGVINAKVFGAEGVGFAIPTFNLRHFLDHHEAFAYDKDNPNTGYHYLAPAGVISLGKGGEPPSAGRAPASGSRAPEPPQPGTKNE